MTRLAFRVLGESPPTDGGTLDPVSERWQEQRGHEQNHGDD